MRKDHEECRCEIMEDWDNEYSFPGQPKTCCICEEHDCELYEDYKNKKGVE